MAKWEEIFLEHHASGQIVSRFCSERGIATSSFHSALKRKKKMFMQEDQASLGDLPSTVVEDSSSPQTISNKQNSSVSSSFVPLHIKRQAKKDLKELSTPTTVASLLRVQLCSGHQIFVEAGFDAETLARLIAVLESTS